jgi:hypothetical protein
MTTATAETTREKGLAERVFGVIFAPRATYASVVAHPKVLGMLLVVTVAIAATQYVFLSTEVGQRASLDQQISTMESFGITITDQAMTAMEQRAPMSRYFAVGAIVVFVPLFQAIMAGIFLVVFNAILGGEAGFKQVYAIVVHSGVIGALQQLFVTPLNYMRETLTSATSLNIFFPMLPPKSFIALFAGNLDLFRIWSFISLSIGLGVLYKRRTAPIAWSLFTLYILYALAYAGFQVLRSGA